MLSLVLALALQASAQSTHLPASAPAAPRPFVGPNVLLVIADDVGVDMVSAYGEAPRPPCTPNIDGLAARGTLFRNAWATPVCSPTRAMLLSGRWPFRNGIGEVIHEGGLQLGLPNSATLLPQLLPQYASVLYGKWHLGSPGQGTLHPNELGFLHFAGSLHNLNVPTPSGPGSYFEWLETRDGVQSVSTAYATTRTTDDALAAIATLPEPWLVVVSYNAAHVPRHRPPMELLECPEDSNQSTPWVTKTMVESMDTELGRLLAALAPSDWVFFIGDNGTTDAASEPPFLPSHAKGTCFEGGLNVPFLVCGPGVPVRESEALVSAVDLFATICELAGVASPAEDSVSLLAHLLGDPTPPRATVYSERFSPNLSAPPHDWRLRAIRDARWKLIQESGQPDRLYDLQSDPFELVDLYPPQSAEEMAALAALAAALPTP